MKKHVHTLVLFRGWEIISALSIPCLYPSGSMHHRGLFISDMFPILKWRINARSMTFHVCQGMRKIPTNAKFVTLHSLIVAEISMQKWCVGFCFICWSYLSFSMSDWKVNNRGWHGNILQRHPQYIYPADRGPSIRLYLGITCSSAQKGRSIMSGRIIVSDGSKSYCSGRQPVI